MSNGCGGGGLGGERGGNCGRDLCLICVRHPEINKNCGLELEQATAAAETKVKNQRTIYPVGETVNLWLE
jgi:hypothetical protein